ncbi:11833_t:CDS:2, partial [Racocetra persica]
AKKQRQEKTLVQISKVPPPPRSSRTNGPGRNGGCKYDAVLRARARAHEEAYQYKKKAAEYKENTDECRKKYKELLKERNGLK